MHEAEHQLKIDMERLAILLLVYLVGFELFLVIIDILITYERWIDYRPIRMLCNIAREDGIASWFMTAQTLMSALVLWFLYWLSRRLDGISAFHQRGWLVLALFFSFMAIDDGAMIHERLGATFELVMRKSHQIGDVSLLGQMFAVFPSYGWQFIVLPFFILMGFFTLYFLWDVLGRGRPLILVFIALSCFAFAVGLDFIEGMRRDHPYNMYTWIKDTYVLGNYEVDHFAKSLEEFLEMLGISLFFSIFVAHVNQVAKSPVICFGRLSHSEKI